MNRIEKLLQKLSPKERATVKSILLKINSRNYKNLDIKKLKGNKGIFRVRKGDMRIIFTTSNKDICVLSIGRKNDVIYNKLPKTFNT